MQNALTECDQVTVPQPIHPSPFAWGLGVGTVCSFWKVLRAPSGDTCISRGGLERQVTPKAFRPCSAHTHDWPWAQRKAALSPGLSPGCRCGRAGQAAGRGDGHSCHPGAADAGSRRPPRDAAQREDVPIPSHGHQSDVTRPRHTSRNWPRWDTSPDGLVLGPVLTTPPIAARRTNPRGRGAGTFRAGPQARPPHGARHTVPAQRQVLRGPRPPYLGVLLARGPVLLLLFGGLSSLRWLLCGRPGLRRALGLRLHLRLNDDDLDDVEEG